MKKLSEIIATRNAISASIEAAKADLARANAATERANQLRATVADLTAKRGAAIGEAYLSQTKPDTAELDAAIAAAEREIIAVEGPDYAASHAAKVAAERIATATAEIEALSPDLQAAGREHCRELLAGAEAAYTKAARSVLDACGRMAAIHALVMNAFADESGGRQDFAARSIAGAAQVYMGTALVSSRSEAPIAPGHPLLASHAAFFASAQHTAEPALRKILDELGGAGLALSPDTWTLDAALLRQGTTSDVSPVVQREADDAALTAEFVQLIDGEFADLRYELQGEIQEAPMRRSSTVSPGDKPAAGFVASTGEYERPLDRRRFARMRMVLHRARAIATMQETFFGNDRNAERLQDAFRDLRQICINATTERSVEVPEWTLAAGLSDDDLAAPIRERLLAAGHTEPVANSFRIVQLNEDGRRQLA